MKILHLLKQARQDTLLAICCVVAALLVAFIMERPALFDPYVINDDARQHIYWMARFQDPELFQGDPLTDFISGPKFAPYGFVALYYLMSFVVEPLDFSKLLPLILIPLCAVFLFKLGCRLSDALSGLILVVLFLTVIWDRDRFSGGLARSFGYPILILFFYSLVQKRYLAASASLVAGALFYPPISLVCAGTWVFSFLDLRRLGLRPRQKCLAPFVIGCAVGLTVLAFAYIAHKDDGAGRLVTYAEAVQMPEFHLGGRAGFFRGSLLFRYVEEGDRSGLGLEGQVKILLVASVVIGLVVRAKAFSTPKHVWHLMLSSLCLFVLAHLLLFRLFLPGKYCSVAIPLALMVIVSIHLRPAIQKLAERIPSHHLPAGPADVAVAVAVALVLSFFIIGMRSNTVWLLRFPQGNLTSFIATLPKDVLIAGHPEDMDWIPIFSRRRVLVNQELSLPFYVGYYRMIRERTYDVLDAYYANSGADIRRFCRKHQVDYFVVNRARFPSQYFQTRRIYDEPYNRYIKAKIAGRQRFAALELPPEIIVWQDSRFLVADCRRMAEVMR